MFKQLAITALLSIVAMMAAACTPAAQPEAAPSNSIPFATLAQGTPLGDQPTQPLYTVATQPDRWRELTDRMPTEAGQAGAEAVQSNQILVLAFAGVRSSGGYQISVERIVREGDRLAITVSETEPDPDQIVEPATTLPYHLVALSPNDANIATVSTIIFQNTEEVILDQQTR